ncbi:hypothetical protein Aph01nite_76240 [Acrocarpospora phusangensis]|uniref:Uncharacterized protein n=1 Tax=Acrocarpospora phusangensis TaxID=1070424 RepID=A0A919UPZ8_9ACTN|nr:hypothetical protein [Acrocarpospora phusangensis]GIH29314.1 hypothetical protein Aph01nite_76240 [Acrocarpospora phusangensis]
MLKKSLLSVACGLALVAAVPAPASAATTKPLHLRKGLTLSIPKAWKVFRVSKDWTRVVTGRCPKPTGFRDSGCRSFWVLGPEAIKVGHEGFSPYEPSRPFYPASDVSPCVYDKNLWTGEFKLAAKGLRQVGPGHKANYREWKAACLKVGQTNSTVKGHFYQREWFLPASKILVVDQWRTPALPAILKNAAWN